MSQPPIVTMKLSYPGSLLDPSLFDLSFVSSSVFGPDPFDAWCADRDLNISLYADPAGGYSTTLQATVHSTYEPNSVASAFPTIETPENLDAVNWLLNQNFSRDDNVDEYTSGEVQAAVWTLLGDDYTSSTLIGPRDPAKVTELVNLALQHDGYRPDITDSDPNNDNVAVLLAPYTADGTAQQPIIFQMRSAALGDRVWLDADADGVQDANESGVSGVAVNLWRDLDNDQVFDANELLSSTTTDANGNYKFIALTPGLDYQVQFAPVPGYVFTGRDLGGDDAADSDANVVNGTTGIVVLDAGEWDRSVDAGLIQRAHLGDLIWEDKNANGQQDAGENGIAGVTVNLKDANGNVVATTTTDANGNYGFDVLPGTYSVAIVPPGGYTVVPANVGNDASASDINPATNSSGSYTLNSGDVNNTVDGGLYRKAELGDRVWYDTNGDGQQTVGEAGAVNVTVQLKDAGGNVISTQQTDANGNYLFTNLNPGTYSVSFVAPAGYIFTRQDIGGDASDSDVNPANGNTIQTVLESGESDRTWDAGLVQRAHIGDRIWEDKNANGQQDAGENGIGGVTVNLKDANGNVVAFATTDANGNYGFDVLPGTYSVAIVPPSGYTVTSANVGNDASDSDINPATNNTGSYTLNSGDVNNTVDGGLYRKAELGDRVWYDTNGDGQQTVGEAGAVNVTVQLKDAGGNVISTQQTDANGNYLFTNLNPGTYSVSFVAPAGYIFTQQDIGGDASDSDVNPANGNTIQTVLDSGESDRTWDAGLVQRAHIGDRIWEDKNANGQQDAGENGIGGVTVNLKDANGNVVAFATTDTNGNYGFDVLPGTYSVAIVPPSGYTVTSANVGNDASDSDINPATNNTGSYTLNSGDVNNTVDGGLYRKAELGDRVWYDTNGDGQQTVGENGAANVTVQLKDAGGNVISTQQTDANGNYLFTNLNPGTYSVSFVAPAGYIFTRQDIGGDASDSDVNPANGNTIQTVLDSGESDRTWDAGLVQRAHIGDRIWEDKNANGQQDAGENGIAGVTVNLKDANGNVVAFTTTDANGNYGFDVVPGTYSVAIVPPSGYTVTPANVGNDASDSDINPATNSSGSYTLNSGDVNNTVDGGLYRKAELGDRVWYDTNGDGQQTVGEAGAVNVTVQLKDAGGNVISTQQTDANGNYLFTNLNPGTYSVSFVAPAGYVFTRQDIGADSSDSDVNPANGNTIQTVLDSGESDRTWDAGLVQRAHIGDRIWEDNNANGQQDAGENGIGGVTVNLKDANGNVVGTTTTDANGIYGFDVLPGTYSVAIVPPSGYVVTSANVGNDASDSDINSATNSSGSYTLASGEVNNTVDGGLYRLATIGDRVWYDNNGNGVQDAGEGGVDGVAVQLRLQGSTTLVAQMATDANGNYLFTNVTPGDYFIDINESTLPAGYVFTTANATGDAADSDVINGGGWMDNTTLTSGEDDRTWDAGLVQRAHIGDKIWEDKNANGQQDAGENGIAGVTVNLKDAGGNVVGTTTTDANGIYGFDVLPGTYSVAIVPPSGYTVTQTNVGNDASDSDINPATNNTGSYTLNSGDVNNTVDGGLYRKAELGDRVWYDTNGDGQQTAGEAGAANVTVQLKDAGGNVISTQQTDANGNYLFTNLNPGTYSVSFVAPAGYVFTQQDIGGDGSDSDVNPANGNTIQTVLESGESDRTWDAGLVQRAHIGDRIWEDNNANGQQDAGENGIAGVTVNLKDANGNVVGTTTTDANGIYGFDVPPGTYSVAIVPPSGYVVTSANVGNDASDSDINSATNSSGSYTLVSGEVNNTVDGGLYRLATIGDRVWYDNNGNGVQDAGEGGVAGVNVHLRLAGSTTLVSQTTTDANGNYLFTNVTPGDYFVDINEGTLPAGYVFTTANATGDAADSDVINGGGWMDNTTLTSGEDDRTWDAGIMQPRASIGNYVWEDSNFNGVQDAGESGIGGVTVKLLNSGGSVVGTTTTDAAGQYLFSNLTPGDYKVQVVAPSGYYTTWTNIGDDALDSDIVLTDGSMSLTTLSAGENDLTWDAGLYRKAEIGDRVWLDNNGNGFQDAGETGVANVTVSLKNSSGTVVATQQTDYYGNYLFSGLNPGTYSIQVSAPAGYSFTWQDIGGDGSDSDVNSSGNTVQTFLTSGESDRTWDAGLLAPKACIGNFVWEDRNYNGIQDAGESGIGGVTVRLLNSSGSVVGTTTTDGAGQYLFSNLTPGDYRVQVVAPSGYYLTKSNQGANDAVDSDADSNGNMSLTNLSPGENDLTWDAGLYRKASIGDRVWDDFNSNGIQDYGESGIRNCKVWLYSGSSGAWIASTYTDYYGNYKFTNLDPGSYYLWFDKSQAVDKNGFSRANWNWTYRDVGYNDAVDSDLISNGTYTGYTVWTTLDSGENDMTWDAGICPIAIDLNGDGVHTVARADSGGKFDLFGNGNAVASGWLSGNDGFLAVDRNGNGAIDNIGELFGGNAVGAGFAQLASFDSNADGVVNAADAGFADLKVWQDANGNHQTDSGELMSLAEAGVVGLFVDYTALPFLDANHNLHLERGVASMADGRTASMTDVYFNVALADAAAAGVQLSTMAELLGDAGGVAVDVAQANPANDAVFADAPPVIDQGWLFA